MNIDRLYWKESETSHIRDVDGISTTTKKTLAWVIQDCSKETILNSKNGEFTISNRFEIALNGIMTQWSLEFYRNGCDDDSKSHISLLLKLNEYSSTEFNIKFRFRIMNNTLTWNGVNYENTLIGDIESNGEVFSTGNGYGSRKLVHHDDLFTIADEFVNLNSQIKLFFEISLSQPSPITHKLDETSVERTPVTRSDHHRFFDLFIIYAHDPSSLQKMCIKKVISTLSSENVLKTLEISCAMQCQDLFEECFEMVLRNYDFYSGFDEFKNLSRKVFMKISEELMSIGGREWLSNRYWDKQLPGRKALAKRK